MSPKNAGHSEVWQMLRIIVHRYPAIVDQLKVMYEGEHEGWAKPFYELALLIRQHASIAAAISSRSCRESTVRLWLSAVYTPAYTAWFVEWLDREGYVVDLINHMGVLVWPRFETYFNRASLSDPAVLRSFVIEPTVGTILAQYIGSLEAVYEEGRQRAHYARSILDGSIGLKALQRAEQLEYEERQTRQQPTTEREKKLQAAEKVRIEELDFSIRTFNALQKADIQTLADLAKNTEEELMNLRNFGRKSLVEVKEKLSLYELELTG